METAQNMLFSSLFTEDAKLAARKSVSERPCNTIKEQDWKDERMQTPEEPEQIPCTCGSQTICDPPDTGLHPSSSAAGDIPNWSKDRVHPRGQIRQKRLSTLDHPKELGNS